MATDGTQPVNQTNGLGIAGLVVSILGILTCGVISPLGLLLSLIALLKPPRGLAAAGAVLGLLGIAALVGVSVFVFFLVNTGIKVDTTRESAIEARDVIEEYYSENEAYPDGIEGNKLIAGMVDAWGNDLRYDADEDSYLIRSASHDGKMETEDDIVITASDVSFDFGEMQLDVDDPDLGIELGDGDVGGVPDGGDDTGDN